MTIDLKYRRIGITRQLITKFEKRCLEKNIKHIDLGSCFRTCTLYLSMNYKLSLMIQGFDFVSIEDIEYKYNFKERLS